MKLFTHNLARDIQSPAPKKQSKFSSTKTVRSHVSPLTKSSKKTKYSSLLSSSSSSSSIETFGKISLFENSSDARTAGSPIIKVSTFQATDSTDFEAELDLCRKQNLNLQSKIEQLQKKTSNRPKGKNSSIFTKETERNKANQDFKASKTSCYSKELWKRGEIRESDRDYEDYEDIEDSDDKETCFVDRSEIQREFEIAHDQVLRKVNKRHAEQILELEETLKEKFRKEMEEIEKDHELKITKKIAEITSEYERKLDRALDEVQWHRKQNDKMKRALEEANSKIDVFRHNSKHEDISARGFDTDKKFNDLQKQFMALQHDYLKLKKEGGLCSKCKAFTETNDELLTKINRIRSYIESSVN